MGQLGKAEEKVAANAKAKLEATKKQAQAEKDARDQWMAGAEREAVARRNAAGARAERGKFTLGELADINIGYNTSGQMAGNIMSARRIAWIEKDAKLALELRGDKDPYYLAQKALADKMRDDNTMLSEGERRPFAALDAAVIESNKFLKSLDKATKGFIDEILK
jgi:hypothetical protein